MGDNEGPNGRRHILKALSLHFDEEKPLTDAAEEAGVSRHRLLKRIQETGQLPRCAHCRGPVHDSYQSDFLLNLTVGRLYCSEACETAGQNDLIECPDCDFECRTVGRFRSHQQSAHGPPQASNWEPESSWRDARETVLERDGYLCARCGMSQDAHQTEYDKSLEVHHIIKRRQFNDREQADFLGNLVTLCVPCHNDVEAMTPYELFHFCPDEEDTPRSTWGVPEGDAESADEDESDLS